MNCRTVRGARGHRGVLLAVGLLVGLVLAVPAAKAIRPVQPGAGTQSKAGYAVIDAQLDVAPSIAPTQRLSLVATANADAAKFVARHPGNWSVTWDRRSDRPNMVSGSGVPLVPGRGNNLTRAQLGLRTGSMTDLAIVSTLLDGFISDNAGLLKTKGLQFKLVTKSVVPFGPHNDHWFVRYQQVKNGVPVKGAHLFFRIVAGNIVQFGTYLVAPVKSDTQPTSSRSQAFAKAFAKLAFPPGTKVVDWLDHGSLNIVPYLARGGAAGEAFAGTLGSGYAHRLVWRFVFRVNGDRTTYRVLMDAHSDTVIDVRDINEYATATVDGGVYPVASPNTVAEIIKPFPFVSVSNGGTAATDANGQYNYGGGTASTRLDGQYISISDNCGNPSLSNSSNGNLHFGTSGGTDCTVANGNATHSARNAFYYLTTINRKAASYYPSNSWLNGKVTANVNIDDACNAFWNGSTLNFFKSGSIGNTQCANTGELPGVFMHEFGHGIQENVGGNPSDQGTGEATGDTFAFLQTHDGCIGDGFLVNGSGDCTGVRDVSAYSVAAGSGFVVKPANITAAGGPDCDNGLACPYMTGRFGLQPYQGPMGYEGHCESYIASSANWDLAQALVGSMGAAAGWQKMDDLWYAILPSNTAAYQVQSGGKCNTSAVVNGCASNNWYNLYLAADDDDGNLANGTPNACRIWDAFDAHGIACGTRPVCSSVEPPPVIEVSPASLSGSQAVDNTVTHTLAIGNTGGSDLTWSIQEAPSTLASQTVRAAPLVTTPRQTFVRNLVTAPMAEVIEDGSFEQGDPNPYWDAYSQNFGTVLCDPNSCSQNPLNGAHSGQWWAWFGGLDSAETSHLYQTVTLVSGTATLSFWVYVPADSGLAADYLAVSIDSTELWRVTADAAGAYAGGYQQVTLDVSAFADGGSHDIKFDSKVVGGGAGFTNFFVDDVSLDSQPTPVGCDNPGDIAWLSLDLSSGTTPASGSDNVTVTFDSTGLAAATYTAQLCVNSDDPVTPRVEVPVSMTVTAPTLYTVTANSTGNGSIDPASQSVTAGATASFTVTPDIGYHVASVVGDTCTVTGSAGSYSAANIQADCAVTATFAIKSFTVTAGSGGNGSITPASQSVDYDGSANFTVTPDVGYHVVSVIGDTCTVTGSAGSYSAANIQADCAVTATFAIKSFTVTAGSGGNGSITPASQSVDYGGSASFTVTPDVGYHVVSVIGDTCTVTGSAGSYSAANIQADCAVTASFAIDSFTVTASSGGNGNITPPSQSVDYDGTANFTVTPATGYHVVSVSGDTCTVTGSAGNYSAANIQADCAVTATFAPNALVFVTQPVDVSQGNALAAVVVQQQDGSGNPVVGDNSSSVSFSINVCGGSLSLGSVTVLDGVATLTSGQRFYELAAGRVIHATSSGALNASADSAAFSVVTNPDLVFSTGFESCRP